MGRRGPAPTPTAKLKVTGSWRAKRREKDGEPQPRKKAPRCPAWLSKEAKAEWKKLVPELLQLGLLTIVDEGALAGYCSALAELRHASLTLDEAGHYVEVGGFYDEKLKEWRGGQLQPHPAMNAMRSAWKAVKEFSALFGLDPSSRTRISVKGVQADAEAEGLGLKAFIGGKKKA